MTSRLRLNELIPDLAATLTRFPVPVAIAAIGLVVANLDIGRFIDIHDEIQLRLYGGLISAFWLSAAIVLNGEAAGKTAASRVTAGASAAAFMLVLWWFNHNAQLHWLFFLPGLVLVFMVAGFVRRDGTSDALWYFNARFALSIVLAGLVVLAFCGGLSAIVRSIDFLFGVKPPRNLYEHIWVSGLVFIAPLYGLSVLPDDLNQTIEAQGQNNPVRRGVSVLVNYVLAPIIIVYAFILHAYAAKIMLAGELPRGQVGMMVLLYALGGTAAVLICWPWRNTGTRLVRFLARYWLFFTVVPVVLLVLAVWRRVIDYGVTPDRYGLVIIAVWIAGLFAWFIIKRMRFEPKAVLGSLGILLLLGGVGPWGAVSVSVNSQVGLLMDKLEKLGYLDGGKLKAELPSTGPRNARNGRDIASGFRFLRDHQSLDSMRSIFAETANDPFKRSMTPSQRLNRVLAALRVDYKSLHELKGRFFWFEALVPVSVKLDEGAALFGPIDLRASQHSFQPDAGMLRSRGTVLITADGKDFTVPVSRIASAAAKASKARDRKPLRIELSTPVHALLYVTEARGRIHGTVDSISTLTVWLLIPKKSQ